MTELKHWKPKRKDTCKIKIEFFCSVWKETFWFKLSATFQV